MTPGRLGVTLLGLLLVVVGSSAVIGRLADGMLYPAPSIRVPEDPPAPLVDLSFDDDDGNRVVVWASVEGTGPEVLWFHGNGENLATLWRAGLFERFRALGSPVVALDYPGYGRSGGKPGQASIAGAALELLNRRQSSEPDRLRVVAGWSLGAAVAAQLAAARPESVDGLVLLSAWESLPSVARRHFPGWLVGWGLGDQWDSSTALGSFAGSRTVPVLLGHGAEDRLIPLEEGRRLRGAAPEARWVELPGVGHNDLLGRGTVWTELARFLGELRERPEGGTDEAR